MAIDPTRQARQWLGFFLLVGLSLVVLVTLPWEFFIRHDKDIGVFPACLLLITLVLVGPVGIRFVQARQNGGDQL